MEINFLQWDSDFFSLRIGRVDLHTKDDARELLSLREKLKEQYDLLYVFDANKVGFAGKNARLVDEKILYSKHCEPREQYCEITLYKSVCPSDDLYRLALISGGYSRFKLDERLPHGSFERLYNRWIENSCPTEGTNKQIFIYQDAQGIIKGMITIDHKGELGHVGLVAVDADVRRQGIGGKIMSTLEGYLYQHGVKNIEVPTQKANTNACRLYEKNGFTAQSIISIYHWWL